MIMVEQNPQLVVSQILSLGCFANAHTLPVGFLEYDYTALEKSPLPPCSLSPSAMLWEVV